MFSAREQTIHYSERTQATQGSSGQRSLHILFLSPEPKLQLRGWGPSQGPVGHEHQQISKPQLLHRPHESTVAVENAFLFGNMKVTP